MRTAFVWAVALAADLHPQHAPTPVRRVGEYLEELSRKPAKLARRVGLAEVKSDHLAELAAQLDARAAPCNGPPMPLANLQVHEVHEDALAANTTHFVVKRGESLLHVRSQMRRTADSQGDYAFHVQDVDPPLCAEEPEEDGMQVLSSETKIVADTLAWMQAEVDARRLVECADQHTVRLGVEHATVKVAAGMVVGLVLKVDSGGPGLDKEFPTSVRGKAEKEIPGSDSHGDPVYHRAVITWEYAALQSIQNALTAGDVLHDETHFLIPYGRLPVEPCELLSESTFVVGTLPVASFFQRYSGYKGFDKGMEHVDLIPPTEPRAMWSSNKKVAKRSLLRMQADEKSCPKVCARGFTRHFADLFFKDGDSSCYTECECSSDANYATVCNKCCRVKEDGQCEAIDLEERCDDVPEPGASFDLREAHPDCFPPTIVEDQGLCGSCFAFATVGASGDRLCMKQKHRLVDEKGYRHLLSVQNFLSCNEAEDDEDFPSLMPKKWGCDGGYFLAAARFLLRDGVTLQDHYPYTSKCVMEGTGVVNDKLHLTETHLGRQDKTCEALEQWLPRDLLPCSCQVHSTNMRTCAKADRPPVKIGSMYRMPNTQDISPHTGTFYKHEEVERMMQIDLMNEGTLYAAFRVYEDFDGFFFDDPDGVYQHRYGQLVGGHAIVIVGWGTKDGVPYWLIRNSWGTNWGDGGHFRIRRGTNECAIEGRVWGAGTFDEDLERPAPVNPWTLYGYHEGQTFVGHDLRREDPRSLQHLKEACKFDEECIGFDSSGQLKKAFPDKESDWVHLAADPIEHGDRVGTTVGGFYTKLTREKVVVQTSTAHSANAESLGPLEVYLCDTKSECAPIPVELAGLVSGKQVFEKDAWLPAGFKLASVEVYNRNKQDAWAPDGPIVVSLPQRPGSQYVKTESFSLTGSFSPEKAPWQSGVATMSLLALLLLQ